MNGPAAVDLDTSTLSRTVDALVKTGLAAEREFSERQLEQRMALRQRDAAACRLPFQLTHQLPLQRAEVPAKVPDGGGLLKDDFYLYYTIIV